MMKKAMIGMAFMMSVFVLSESIYGGESYLHKIIFKSAKAVKIKHAHVLSRYDSMTFLVAKKQIKNIKRQVKGIKKIKVRHV